MQLKAKCNWHEAKKERNSNQNDVHRLLTNFCIRLHEIKGFKKASCLKIKNKKGKLIKILKKLIIQ